MSLFVARIYEPHKSAPILHRLEGALTEYSPGPVLDKRSYVITDRAGVELFVCNSGQDERRFLYRDDEYIIILCGTCRPTGTSRWLCAEDLRWLANDPRPYFFGGSYLIAAFSLGNRKAFLWNTLSRAIPSYISLDSVNSTIVSNRASLASIVRERGDPKVDVLSLFPFAFQGFCPSEQCTFEGVRVVPAHSFTEVRQGSYHSSSIDDALDALGTGTASNDTFDEILSVLTTAVVPDNSGDVSVGLTGGRDSRLIAAALKESGSEFSTYTLGDPEHPDATLAADVARVLKVPHRAEGSKKRDASVDRVIVDPRRQTLSALFSSDWNTYGYERIGSQPDRFRGRMLYKGTGGELLRGGYKLIMKSGDFTVGRKFVERLWADHGILKEYAKNGVNYEKQKILKRFTGRDSIDVLNLCYLIFRSGRWGSGTYMANQSDYQRVPLSDNELIRAVLRLPCEIRAGEYLYYELLRRINPVLVTIPFFGKAFPFTADPLPGYEEVARSLPEPISGKAESTSLFNWRFEFGSNLGKIMRSEIEASLDQGLDKVVEADNLRAFLDKAFASQRNRVLGKAVWGFYSVAFSLEPTPASRYPEAQLIEIPVKASSYF